MNCHNKLTDKNHGTNDFMTASWAKLPYELLDKVSNRII